MRMHITRLPVTVLFYCVSSLAFPHCHWLPDHRSFGTLHTIHGANCLDRHDASRRRSPWLGAPVLRACCCCVWCHPLGTVVASSSGVLLARSQEYFALNCVCNGQAVPRAAFICIFLIGGYAARCNGGLRIYFDQLAAEIGTREGFRHSPLPEKRPPRPASSPRHWA